MTQVLLEQLAEQRQDELAARVRAHVPDRSAPTRPAPRRPTSRTAGRSRLAALVHRA